MKVVSLYRTQRGSDYTGVILLTEDRTLVRQEGAVNHPILGVCGNCVIREDLCSYGVPLCGAKGYFVDVEPTEEIEHARDLLILKGELK